MAFEYENNYFESPKYLLMKDRQEYNHLGISMIITIILQLVIIPLVFIVIGGFLYSDMFSGQPMSFLIAGSYFMTLPLPFVLVLASSTLLNAVPLLIFVKQRKMSVASLFKGGKTLSFGKYCTLFAICMTINMAMGYLSSLLSDLSEKLGGAPLPTLSLGFDKFDLGTVLLFLAVCFIAPVVEEFIFRGVLLRVFGKKSLTFGVVVSAFLFALTHGNIPQAIAAFFLGIMFGIIAVKTKSLVAPIVLHIANNTFATLSDISANIPLGSDNQLLPTAIGLIMLILAVVAIVAAIKFLITWFKNGRPLPEKVKHNGYKVLFTSAALLIYMTFYIGFIAWGIISAVPN